MTSRAHTVLLAVSALGMWVGLTMLLDRDASARYLIAGLFVWWLAGMFAGISALALLARALQRAYAWCRNAGRSGGHRTEKRGIEAR